MDGRYLMDAVVHEWAGKSRPFCLRFGDVLDLEESLGREGIGAIYQRVARGQFRARDLFEIVRLALIGGGEEPATAQRLVSERIEHAPLADIGSLAAAILQALMTGIEPASEGDAAEGVDPDEPYRFSEVSQICRVFHMSPRDLREMPYADFINMLRGFNAGSEQKAQHISEAEFEDILARYEPEAS